MISRLLTHSGPFHADDVFACAVLRTLFADVPIARSRDRDTLGRDVADAAVAVIDVGNHFERHRHNYDHHQRDFDRRRRNGVPYASLGLVWESWGSACVEAVLEGASRPLVDRVTAAVEQRVVWPIDAADCGDMDASAQLRSEPHTELEPIHLSAMVALLNPVDRDFDAAFERAVAIAASVLGAAIRQAALKVEAEMAVAQADSGQPVLELPRHLPWHRYAGEHHRFVIYPSSDDTGWLLETVQDDFVPRCALPLAWAGLRDEDLAAVCGVADARFCHRARFIGGAASRAGVLAMAALALDACAREAGGDAS